MTNQQSAFAKIEAQLKKDKVVVYMKGTHDMPRCGFSAQAVSVLQATGKPFVSYDVLGDEELWNHLDEYAGWETFPQVFVDGKLIGGCDIVTEMLQSGQLQKLLDESFAAKATT